MTKEYGTPGPRAIWPELCDSRSLGRVGLLANALFPRLIAQADDQGRLAGGPRDLLVRAAGNLLHLDGVSVSGVELALEELEREGMLRRYQARGEEYVQLQGWWQWQRGARRAYPSRHPAPRGWQDVVFGRPGRPDEPTSYQAAVELRQRAAPSRKVREGADPAGARDARIRPGPISGPARPGPNAGPVPVPDAGGAPASARQGGALAASAQAVLDDPNASEEAKAGARTMLGLEQQRQRRGGRR